MKAYIEKIVYELPKKVIENPKNRLTKKTGIYSRHICDENEIAADLALRAGEKLFATGIAKSDIDYLLLCTQSPSYYLPTTACILQAQLGLPDTCAALDYNLGCSGYIYGLSLAKGLIESGQAKKVLLLTAETYSKYIHPQDNTVLPLFGDAATATLIIGSNVEKSGINGVVLGTNGTGYDKLIVPVGGMVHREGNTEVEKITDDFGNFRTNRNLYMNGSAISDFALDVVPKTIEQVLEKACLKKDEIDYYVLHQANKFMLEYLQQKCDLLDYPFWNDVKEYGNTVSSSIPLAIVDMLEANKDKNIKNILSVGFGVGLSWGGCIINLEKYKL